ncbi:GH-E family nuclease [Mycobacteroides abscessus]|uniref:GH-E family nuclease n=1 Tax=Mycobacteroides abscessus TaxID=36809 RepID=UPI00177FE316|nr:GH-E family nuclease [Mycobacteroides abscessus]MBE5459747.1 hypothetical protein [Mycobacteroides abscessus]QOF43806.1 hypothetical protein E3G69_002855 [Mycobacteroides abscessus]QOF48504.1 hypothetical protein E3G70_002853 [Mycobacteroides abscessus]
MTENKHFRARKGKLISVRDCYRIWPAGRRESLAEDPTAASQKGLPAVVKALAILAVVAIPLSVVQPTTATQPMVSAAEQFGQAATAAFSQSAAGLDASLTSTQRAAGLPVNPAAGLVSASPAGPVEMELPAQLGTGQLTSAGQMVYPDAGAGFDLLAENTRQGYRTVARINSPDGVRAVTTYVRTPADTVMLMHSSGHLTLNEATENADTVGVMSPAEARDAAGRIVYSAYVAKQVAPQLYEVSEVIAPTPSTAWPVYVDPPLAVGDGLAQWSWSDTGDAIGGAVDAVGNSFKKAGEFIGNAMSAQADGNALQAQAVSQTVQEHPTESAMLIGGTALMATGIGSAPGASLLTEAALAVNNASIAAQAIAAADPNNKGLQNVSAAMSIAAALTPQGLGKQTLAKTTENAVEQGLKTGADNIASETATITRVTPQTATNPNQLAHEISQAGKNTEVPGVVPGGEHAWALPPAPGDRRLSTDINARVKPRAGSEREIHANAERDPATGTPLDPYSQRPIEGTPHIGHLPEFKKETADRMSEKYGLSRRERIEFENEPSHYQLEHGPDNSAHVNEIPYRAGDEDKLYQQHYQPWVRENMQTNPRLAKDPTAQRRVASMNQPAKLPARPSSPADLRQVQAARVEQASQAQRSKALTGARTVNSVSPQQSQHISEPQTVHARPESEAQQRDNQAVRNTSVTKQTRDHAREGARPSQNNANTHNGNGSTHDSGSHSKNNGSKKNNKGNGKGNRAKRSRTGRH